MRLLRNPSASSSSPRTGELELALLRRIPLIGSAIRVASYGLAIALAGILLLVAAATAPVLFGYHSYNVEGRSMEPGIAFGSAVVTKETSARALDVGDIIARPAPEGGRPVLHRIVRISADEDGTRLFVTQGDRNEKPDPTPLRLEGPGDRVVYSIPYAGYILRFANSMLGRIFLLALPVALLLAMFLRERLTPAKPGAASSFVDERPSVRRDDDERDRRQAAATSRPLAKPSNRTAWVVVMPLAIAIGVVLSDPGRWLGGGAGRVS